VKPSYLNAVSHTRATDLERFKFELEAWEGSVQDKHAREFLEEALGGLLIAITGLQRLERLSHAMSMAEETRTNFVEVAERSIEMANCRKVAEQKPYPREVKLEHRGTITEASEGR
jgi:hypothetical protein